MLREHFAGVVIFDTIVRPDRERRLRDFIFPHTDIDQQLSAA